MQKQWQNYKFSVKDENKLEHLQIKEALSKFWEDQMINLDNNQSIYIQFKIEDVDGLHRSISFLQEVNKTQFNLLLKIFCEFWDLKMLPPP